MTDEQGLALARLMRDRPKAIVKINPSPFDLPEGYVEVEFIGPARANAIESAVYVCGIAPDGRVSS